jgi:heme A synthase
MNDISYRQTSKPEQAKPSHRTFTNLALSGLISTIILIIVGAIVRVTGHGLGCPDWPLCYGRAIPPFLLSPWVEFLHRLFGAAVVIQIGALIVLAFRRYREDKWIYRTAIAASVILTIQVVLGGIHVLYELPRWTGWIHTGVAMMVAGLVGVWTALTQPALRRLSKQTAGSLAKTRLPFWTAVTAGATYLLLLTGSLVTRTGSSLVCPSFPFCGLPYVPSNLRSTVTIQMTHRFTAMAVAFGIGLTLWYLLKSSNRAPGIKTFSWTLLLLLLAQGGLGLVNIFYSIPRWSRVLHLGTAAIIWSTMVILTVILFRGGNRETGASSP